MSKLVSAIKHHGIGKRGTNNGSIFDEVVSIQSEAYKPRYSAATVYKVGASFESRIVITDVDNDEFINHAVKTAKNKIIEAVFGEFRENFAKINLELCRRNYRAAIAELEKFEEQMFTCRSDNQ